MQCKDIVAMCNKQANHDTLEGHGPPQTSRLLWEAAAEIERLRSILKNLRYEYDAYMDDDDQMYPEKLMEVLGDFFAGSCRERVQREEQS